MEHPWETIALQDYESHMSLADIGQLQAMNEMMREQCFSCSAETLMILGIAGGNGLAHIRPGSFSRIYGVDINPDYLAACRSRYPELSDTLSLICADLTAPNLQLPRADLLVANLLVEYIGYRHFQRAVIQTAAQYVSCGIQINTDESFVSASPYLHSFDRLAEIHHPTEEAGLTAAMAEIGFLPVLRKAVPLPNGKQLLRLDYAIPAVKNPPDSSASD